MSPPLNFIQPVLSGPGQVLNQGFKAISVSEAAITSANVNIFTSSRIIGLSPGYSSKGKLIAVAICDGANALIVDFNGSGRKKTPKLSKKETNSTGSDSSTSSDNARSPIPNPRAYLEEKIFSRTSAFQFLVAFDMGPLAMSLHIDLDLRVKNAIDVQAAFDTDLFRRPYSAVETALRSAQLDKVKPSAERIESEFINAEYKPEEVNSRKELVCRAWLAHYLISECLDDHGLEEIKKVDTKEMAAGLLDVVAKIGSDAQRLSLGKSTTTKHQISKVRNNEGVTTVHAAAYKHKFRDGKRGKVIVEGERGRYVVHADINSTENGSGTIDSTRPFNANPVANAVVISEVETTGKDNPTLAEARRAATILRVLQGDIKVLGDNPWVQNIWLPSGNGSLSWPAEWSAPISNPIPSPQFQLPKTWKLPTLNGSQQRAVNTMLSPKDPHRLVIVQGPPGTGKTSVIAAYVLMATMKGIDGIWLIAQSNVAVKNIALKLLAVGFEDWKILVAKDFHNGWHEHLYTEDSRFKGHLVLSNAFKSLGRKDMLGCKIILATLSMLSNTFITKFTQYVPMNVLVVDEASQIEIGGYIPALTSFSSLRKICFIGDNKQLPPHGQEALKDLRSIFEVTQLESSVIFLDTQYRMPPEIGDIISSTVYHKKLKSNPSHPVSAPTISCYFIDVPEGKEAKKGTSWINLAEKAVVLKLAQYLQDANKAYKIITPYEAQTTAIEQDMKTTEDLSWEDKCFNVDAFQGNEEDYIIISLVRSRGLGFLDNLRRTNVMLTRCKRGMFIITSKKFMGGIGGDSLVGELLDILEEKLEDQVWLSVAEMENGKMFDNA